MDLTNIDFEKVSPENYLMGLVTAAYKKNSELIDQINRMRSGCERAIELQRLLDELFEIKPNEFVSDDEIRSKMKSLREQCNLLLEEKAGLKKRLRDAEKCNDELTKELAKKLYGDPLPRVHDADTYQRGALRYANPDIWRLSDRIMDGAMGMCGEAGEASEIVKKYAFQNHTLDTEHLASELGDVLWYVAYTADTIGYPLSRIMEINQKKLQSRYSGGKFDAERSRNRKEGDI